jgi:hypothetical protein
MTVNRNELITKFVLDMVADGYEDINRIIKDVINLSERCGMNVQIIHALSGLVSRQLVKAHRFPLDGSPTEEGFEMPPCGKIGEYHFKITSEGHGQRCGPRGTEVPPSRFPPRGNSSLPPSRISAVCCCHLRAHALGLCFRPNRRRPGGPDYIAMWT